MPKRLSLEATTGRHINFWTDSWFRPNISIRQMIHGPLTAHEMNASLASYYPNHAWDISTLSFELSETIINQFLGVYFPYNLHAHDRIIWAMDVFQ